MVYVRYLNKNEKQILKQHYIKSQCRLIRERAHTVILSSQKRPVSDIASILMRNKATIRQWINDFNARRISSIFHQYESNANAGKLTREQKAEIKDTLLKPPSDKKLPMKFWDIRALKEYVKAEFGIVYESDRSYHYLFRLSELSFKLPMPFDVRRDKEQINRRLAEIHREIKPYLADDDWEVLTADETRMTWEAEIRRAWLRKNEKTVVKVHRDSQYQNFFGALNLKNYNSRTIKLSWQNQQEIIRALKELSDCYSGKKLCIIWDNAGWHKGKELRRELRKGRPLEHIHLINFPPYAPDVNPQEHVWNYGKDCVSNDNVPDSFLKTITLFKNSIRNKSFDYKIPEFVLR